MVAKIATENSLYGALAYNQSKIDNGVGKVILSNKMYGGLDEDLTVQSCLRSFALEMPLRFRTEKPIVHISLNPHPDDILTDEQLRDIAQEYMEKMGYGEQPYVVYKHDDIERSHIHIVTTNVDSEGKKIDSDNNFYRSKSITRELEQKYGIHTAERKTKGERQAFTFDKVDAAKGNVKIQVGNVIKPLAATYKFQSFGEYRTLLAQYNICVEESKGVRYGRAYEGLIYYATNDKGEKISNPFKSSMYGRAVGYSAIQEKCNKHKQTIKDKRLGRESAMRINNTTNGITDREGYIKALKDKNIDVVFRESEQGRIYGTTFIDHNNHCVFNGSRLGKEFSANAINDRFESESQGQQQESSRQQFEPSQQQEQHDTDVDGQEHNFSMGGLFDLPADGGDDPEEDAFRRRMQRKKRGRKR